MSVQAAAVARPEHAVAVQQQHRDADELLQLRQRRFVLIFVLVDVLHAGTGQPGQVLQGLAALLRQWRAGTGGQAEAAQETTALVEQRLGTLP